MKAYPLKFRPIYKQRIWGGQKLQEVFKKELPAGEKIGESWEKALRLSVAAATASVTKQGTESPSLEEIEEYKDKGDIHEHQIKS